MAGNGNVIDIDDLVVKIQNADIDLATRCRCAVELRDSIEGWKEQDTSRFISTGLSPILNFLRNGPMAFRKDAPEHQLRHTLLEIINRTPHVGNIKERAMTITDLMLHLLTIDNEENGVLCVKIIIDMSRSFRASEERHVTTFVEMVKELYKNMDSLVAEAFADGASYDSNVLRPSLRSFKVLTDCPIATVLLFQEHRNVVNPSVRLMLPTVVSFLRLQAPQQQQCHEAARANNTVWAGVAPSLQGNVLFRELVTAQVKTMSFLAYILRAANESLRQYQDTIPQASIRLLQDCPADASSIRKELLVATRHILSTDFRQAFISQVDVLLDERILLGPGIASQETLRPLAYSMLADTVHHVRSDLAPAQLARVVKTYSAMVHNPALSGGIQTMCAKLLMTLTESVIAKDTREGAANVLHGLLQSDIDKLSALHEMHEELRKAKESDNPDRPSYISIEKAKPIYGAAFVSESFEDVLKDSRQLFRTLLYGARAILTGLRQIEAPPPDAQLLGQFFEGAVHCLALFKDRDSRDEKEAMDLFSSVWNEVNPHVFQEVWTSKLDFFFEETLNQTSLLSVAQSLFEHEQRSRQLVSISLRHFTDRLDLLGSMEGKRAAVTIRFMKMAFGAVTQFSEVNEPSLAPHLNRLIMDSFPLAAKAAEPANYFLLLKGLFRAIGGGQGRFELLYKEVLPLLPELLESLSKMLSSAEPGSIKRDLLIELNLTVPVRLAHLLKFLHYLMTPLVHALEGSSELVTQGLRTLELMVDNLTSEFLDPTLQPVLRELMTALSKHLKPMPAAIHQHSHTIIRTLGKLGGRNRRLLERNPKLSFHRYSEPAVVEFSLSGRSAMLDLRPVIDLGVKAIRDSDSQCRTYGFQMLCHACMALLHLGINSAAREDAFVEALKGFFDALHIPDFQSKVLSLLRNLLRQLFAIELTKSLQTATPSHRFHGTPLSIFLTNLPQALVCKESDDMKISKGLVLTMIQDILNLCREDHGQGSKVKDASNILHRLASRFTGLCYEPQWKNKTAGFTGLDIMTNDVDLGLRWNLDRGIDVVRALFFVLKDMPHDAPKNSDDVLTILVRVIRLCNRADLPGDAPESVIAQSKLSLLTSVLIQELASLYAPVRDAAKVCISALAGTYGKTPYELLFPHRERLFAAIFSKPLRALPTQSQIGNVDAMTYCLSLEPPLPELNDELMRLLQEALAFADADDANLVVRPVYRQNLIAVNNLRVVCIKLLTASMPLTDLFAKQAATRQRVTGVYFKSLYSSSAEIKKVAHDGLRIVLSIQSRLPRDLLQTGLRPILMNLADPKRLSVPGLEGLARLLALLTNYFRVEIGTKLLDHFRMIAEPTVLRESAFAPLVDNEEIKKLVKLVNIFHLLPPAANIFLDDLVTCVVRVEAQLHSASPSPFTEPVARFLDRYPFESVEFFQRHMEEPQYIRTLRNVLQSRYAPLLEQAFMGQAPYFRETCLQSPKSALVSSGLLVILELVTIYPSWLNFEPLLLGAVINLGKTDDHYRSSNVAPNEHYPQQIATLLDIFFKLLESSLRIDLIFEVISICSSKISADIAKLSRFLYRHVITNPSPIFQRNVVLQFLVWFDDTRIPWAAKTLFIRNVLCPLVQVVVCDVDGLGDVLDHQILQWFHSKMWKPMSESANYPANDDALSIELLNLCSVIVCHCSPYLQDARKDIIKCAWNFISSEDAVVKQCAYLLAARFFEAFESPSKFILSALTGLLRPGQSESRILSRQALDILMPVLPKRLPKEPGVPQWAKLIRRILMEDGHGQSQLVVIYQLIVRHRDLFYPWREIFVPHMVQSLGKLGMSSTTTVEGRLLSLEIVDTIWVWEQNTQMRLQSSQNMQIDIEGDKPYADDEISLWSISNSQREAVVSYLVRLVVSQVEMAQRASMITKSLNLLAMMLGPGSWSEVQVKLGFFSKAFDQPEKEGSSLHLHNSIKVLAIVAKYKGDEWYEANSDTLQEILQKTIASDDLTLLETMQPVLDRFLRVFPIPNQDEDMSLDSLSFHTYAINTMADGLRTGVNLKGSLLLLKVMVQINPERIDQYSQPLMKLLAKFTKEHISATSPSATSDVSVRYLQNILDISRHVVGLLGDQRKPLLTSLIQLIEKSSSPQLCPLILEIVREWILQRKDIYPTLKEKAGLVLKMQGFERLSEALFKDYLNLVYDIYLDTSLRRTDLTVRLEPSFLVGCRCRDYATRQRFLDLLDASIPRSVVGRLSYVIGVQSWEPLSDHHWLYLVLDLLLGSVDGDKILFPEQYARMLEGHNESFSDLPQMHHLITPLRKLLFLDPQLAHDVWVKVFSSIWSSLSRKEQLELGQNLLVLLSKEYHIRQAALRPNVIQTLLCGVLACSPPITLPPHLIKYLGRTFGAWHVSLELLQISADQLRDDEQSAESSNDALAELYAELGEQDMFYGLWRQRSLYPEANAALFYEQNGMWAQAQTMYETAQTRSRNGTQPFTEVEFELWEDHWVLAAQKLQQWDVLMELAKGEGNHDLFLESAWRLVDWNTDLPVIEEHLTAITDIQTPRRRIFEGLAALTKLTGNPFEKGGTEFSRIIDDAMQLSLRKWASLPEALSAAHVPLLQHFQQVLELQEAAQIFASISSTTAQTLEKKSAEIKHILHAWRERLPNLGDDIGIWSDLIAWRQHVFSAINKFFGPFIQSSPQGGAAANSSNTMGYRGYHETAWIINRFAHVARKHQLMEVCSHSLTKIYTLPNIEISEAFLKLREQARCHYQNPSEYQQGLEVINNTNLMYFSNGQKAEFYTLKAMFFSKLGNNDEANRSFGAAVQMDMHLAKAWAEWGKFGDRTFQKSPQDLSSAASAVSCYLQAAGLYKSAKSRPLFVRILWLLSADDSSMTVSRAFDTYKGEAALWYWICLVPQLLISLGHREAKHSRYILLNLAKLFPQALFFHLRTTKEELVTLKRTAILRHQQQQQQMQMQQNNANAASIKSGETSFDSKRNAAQTDPVTPSPQPTSEPGTPASLRQPLEYVEEIVSILKTAFPLLALTMETFVDQINSRFKATPDEDTYRFTSILVTEATTAYTQRVHSGIEDGSVPIQCANNALRFSQNVMGHVRGDFEDDVIHSKPTLREHISKLQKWRDRYERILDSRPRFQPLDLLSHWLVEFQHGKWDDIEIPGQYLEHKDNNSNFVKINRVASKFEVCRAHGFSFRRLTLHGHDGTTHSFAVQLPSARHGRREERLMQLFRIFNEVLGRRKETRKRNILFHLPAAIPFNPNLRLLENDASYITLQDIYDQQCDEVGISREDPILLFGDKGKAVMDPAKPSEYPNLRLEVMRELMAKTIPSNTLSNYMIKTMATPSDLWAMRKQFALQISSATFMTYVMCLSARYPSRFHISRTTGLIHVSEMLPSLSSQYAIFANPEAVPFRLTPNMQHFMTPNGMEGLLTVGLMSIGRSLTEHEFDLDQQLSLFLRDEVLTWYNIHQQAPQVDANFREQVAGMVDRVVKRVETLACRVDTEKETKNPNGFLTAVQTISNLVSMATNPIALAKMNENYHAWF